MMILNLNQIPLSESQVGRKAMGLKKLIDLNLSIPKAFVLTKMAFLKIIEVNELHKEYNTLINQLLKENSELILERIRRMIQDLSFPNDFSEDLARQYHKLCYEPSKVQSAYELIQNCIVAVRASDENRKMDTFTNVKEKTELIKAIKSCWQSYFLESTYNKNNSLAIIIQKMQKTDKTGWVDLSANANIKAIWGQAGFITKFMPDTIILDMNTFKVLSKTKGKQDQAFVLDNGTYVQKILPVEYIHRMVLDDSEVTELIKMTELIYNKIGICSFEFGIHQKELLILNIRLPVIEDIREENPLEIIDLKPEEKQEGIIDNLLEPKNENNKSILDLYEEEQADEKQEEEESDEEIPGIKMEDNNTQSLLDNLSFEEPEVDEVYEDGKIEDIMPIEIKETKVSADKSLPASMAVDKVVGKFKKINPNISDMLDLLAEEIKKELE